MKHTKKIISAAHAQWNAERESLEERLCLTHSEVIKERNMWQDLREQHLCDLAAKDSTWNDLRDQHRRDLVDKDQQYLDAKSDHR